MLDNAHDLGLELDWFAEVLDARIKASIGEKVYASSTVLAELA